MPSYEREAMQAERGNVRGRDFRPDIQGLRALAIGMVVLVHFNLVGIHGGVDVSFVISGFVVTKLLWRMIESEKGFSFAEFYARRARRLIPALSVVAIATIIMSWLFLSPLRIKEIAIDGLFAVLSAINWRLAVEGTDYFAHDALSITPYQHFWSLSIEEQYSLVWPVLLLLLVWLGRKMGRTKLVTAVGFSLIITLSFTLSIIITHTNQPLAYFGFHTRAWELAVGALVAVGAEWFARMNVRLATVMSWTGVGVIITTALLIDENTALPGYAVAGPVIGAALFIAGGCARPSYGAEYLFKRSILQHLGDVSYGWYLWHWPVLLLWPDVFGQEMTVGNRIRGVAVSLLLAFATFYLVEKRIRTSKRLVVKPRLGFALGGALMAIAAGVLVTVMALPLNLKTGGDPVTLASVELGVDRVVLESTGLKELPSNLQPSLGSAAKDISRTGCIDDISVTEAKVRKACIVGDTASKKQAVLLGDSRAWQWADAFDQLGKRFHLRVTTLTKNGCSAAQYTIQNPMLRRAYTECDEWRMTAFAVIDKLKPKLIVVTGRTRQEANRAGFAATFQRLKATGAKLVFLADTPYPDSNVPNCLAQHVHDAAACATAERTAMALPELREMEHNTAREYGAHVIDMTPGFCTSAVCPSVIGGRVVYFDSSHITRTFALWLVPVLASVLEPVLAP